VLHIFLSFSIVSLFVDLQINPFRRSPSNSSAESQSFRFRVKIFSWSAFAWVGVGWGQIDIFHTGPVSAVLSLW
jgi:hypothetical protein